CAEHSARSTGSLQKTCILRRAQSEGRGSETRFLEGSHKRPRIEGCVGLAAEVGLHDPALEAPVVLARRVGDEGAQRDRGEVVVTHGYPTCARKEATGGAADAQRLQEFQRP